MSITFTPGLLPNNPSSTFGTELEHVKLLYAQVEAGTAYVNPLEPEVTNLVTEIDSRTSELNSVKSAIQTDITTLEGFAATAVPPATNLPTGWAAAGYTSSDIDDVISALQSLVTSIDSTLATLSALKTEINTVDVDNFKLHMDLLSGVRDAPPAAIEKPNNPALMGIIRGVTDIEHRFGIAFTNYLVLCFETLFIGDLTVANAKTHIDTDPFNSVTYSSVDVITRVEVSPFTETPADIITDINTYGSPLGTWNTTAATHKPIFEQHITDDTAEYDSLVDKLNRYLQAYHISGYIQDPYYRFMYTDVFGSATVISIANQLINGEIT